MNRAWLLISVFLTGCATQYQYKETANTASLYITGNNKNFFSEAYNDASCTPSKHGIRLATFFGMTKDVGPEDNGKTVLIPAGTSFTLTHYYIDVRFAQNRTCGVTVSFVPEAGKKYITNFSVSRDVTKCDASIVEPAISENNVPSFKYNELYCLTGRNEGENVGRPTWINWGATVTTTKPK